MERNVTGTGEKRNTHKLSVKAAEGKEVFGRPSSRLEQNTKTNLNYK
jgi:hypothetical protein